MIAALWRWLHGPHPADADLVHPDDLPAVLLAPTADQTVLATIVQWESLAEHYEAAAAHCRERNRKYYQARADAAHDVVHRLRIFHRLGATPEWFNTYRPLEE